MNKFIDQITFLDKFGEEHSRKKIVMIKRLAGFVQAFISFYMSTHAYTQVSSHLKLNSNDLLKF